MLNRELILWMARYYTLYIAGTYFFFRSFSFFTPESLLGIHLLDALALVVFNQIGVVPGLYVLMHTSPVSPQKTEIHSGLIILCLLNVLLLADLLFYGSSYSLFRIGLINLTAVILIITGRYISLTKLSGTGRVFNIPMTTLFIFLLTAHILYFLVDYMPWIGFLLLLMVIFLHLRFRHRLQRPAGSAKYWFADQDLARKHWYDTHD